MKKTGGDFDFMFVPIRSADLLLIIQRKRDAQNLMKDEFVGYLFQIARVFPPRAFFLRRPGPTVVKRKFDLECSRAETALLP